MGPAFSLASTLGVMVAVAGGLTVWALLATCAVMVLLALTFTQLTTTYPDAGSSYAWARRAFGEGAGAYAAWVLLLANFFAVLATALPAGVYTLALTAPRLSTNPAWDAGIGCLWIVACALVLYTGMRPSARVAAALVVAELLILAASVVASLLAPAAAPTSTHGVANATPALAALAGGMVLAIWMLDGWEVSASTSEETRGASDSAGYGGIAGLLVTAATLLACTLAYLRLGGIEAIGAHQVDVLAFVGDRLGPIWKAALIVTVLISLTAALEATLLYLVRSVYAMGRDSLLPRALGRLGARTRDPDVALAAVTLAVLAATALVGFVPSANAGLALVLNGTAIFLGLLFLISCASALKLRAGETPLYASTSGVALVAVLAVAVAQVPPATRWCVLGGLALGLPVALLASARSQARKVGAPAARNIGG
ncbi:MAG: APC family permease [Candidatus Eremiobacteraeota bacterium]|nr:APC family permease [Candidatus Eremiobacteraeota bacterium]